MQLGCIMIVKGDTYMELKRKIYAKLLEWKETMSKDYALMIEGARRIGKSTIVEEFAEKEFPNNYIIVDFRKELEEVKELFNDVRNLNSFFQKFFLFKNHVLREGGLIVFDEIQFCPKAREAIKDFLFTAKKSRESSLL